MSTEIDDDESLEDMPQWHENGSIKKEWDFPFTFDILG